MTTFVDVLSERQRLRRKLYFVFKRIFDVVFSLLALVVLAPFFVIIAILIRLDSPGSAIFSQTRIGRGGKPFICYKFRSMIDGADQTIYEQFLKEVMHSDSNGPKGINDSFRIKNGQADPRVTRMGRFIRSMSIDEFPQLVNVLRGDMSLIGPRPDVPLSVEGYTEFEQRRLQVLPGMTGLWQVSGRARLKVHQMFELDNQYVEECSMWLDIKILLKTIPAIIRRDGAA